MREKVFILLLFSQFNFAQNVAWENFIGGKNSEYLFDMIPTADEGFILGGSSLSSKTGIKNSDNLGDLDFFMWKMNHKGKIDWEFNFGGSNQDILKKIIQTKDGGYLLAGFTNSNNIKNIKNFGYNDILILKLNAFGVIEWSKSFGNKGNDELIDIIEVKDGYVFTAKSDSNLLENHKNHGNTFSLIYKVDTKGNIKWTNSYSGDKNDVPVSIIESNNNIYVAINSNSNKKGSKELNKIGKYDIVLLKINNEGILTDQKIYGNEGDDYAVKFQKRENELYIAGYTYSKENVSLNFPTSKDDSDIFLLKINEELNIISNHVFHIKGEDILTSITIDQNENLNFGAYRIDQKTGYKNMFVFKVNNENEIIWKKDFNNKYDNILRSIIFTRDNSLVIASNTNKKSNNSNGNYDFNILKFESEEITKKNKNNEKYNIEAFPNPTQQYTNINVNYDFDEAKLHIFDINGKLIFSKSITNRSIPIDVSIYPQGIYIVNVISNISNNSVKIIKN